jgi:hypothetical protein
MAARCADAGAGDAMPAAVGAVTETAAAVAARLASHVPSDLRPASV